MLSVLRDRDYRLLFSGQGISHLGDQFHLIALPWLVLTLTHDPLQLGLVLAVAGIPRAALMLVGGAFADRHSPRAIMLVSDILRFVVTAALAAAVLTGTAEVWMVYALAFTFGVVSGFFMPAAEATVPRLLEDAQLESGNGLIMGANQLASFVGPAAAGLLIAAFGASAAASGSQAQVASLTGIGAAFVIDACSFLVSAACLAGMRRLPALNPDADTHPLADVAAGIRYAMSSRSIKWMILLMAMANFLITGPMLVGVPVLADTRFAGGAAALGVILSAAGLGSLAGMLVAASTKRPSDTLFSWLVVALMAGFGVAMGALAFVSSTWLAAGLMLLTGLGDGYIAVVAMTAVQRMADEAFLGRLMSLIMLAAVGLIPVSQALSGAIIRISPEALFLGSGIGFAGIALLATIKRSMWAIESETFSAEVSAEPA